MILVSKFMVHRVLSDKTYLSLGLLSPFITKALINNLVLLQPIKFNGEHRLNVEEKKPRGEGRPIGRGPPPRSGSAGGGGGFSRGGSVGRGNIRGGGGGGGPPGMRGGLNRGGMSGPRR